MATHLVHSGEALSGSAVRLWPAVLMALVFSVSLATSVFAQSNRPSLVAGVVKDSTGAVLVSATVVIASAENGTPVTVTTDSTGRFDFRGLPPGKYRISASAAGFAESTRTIEVGAGVWTSVAFLLKPAVVERVEVTPLGLNSTAGLNSTTITGAALDALPDDSGALLQRVRELAGATDTLGQVEVTVDGFRQLL